MLRLTSLHHCRRQDVALNNFKRLLAKCVVIPAGKHDHHIQTGEDKDKLPASSSGVKGFDRHPSHIEWSHPPLIAISRGFHPIWQLTSVDVIRRGIPHPLFADNLLSLPTPTVQKQRTDFRHIARPQAKSAARLYKTAGIDPPVVVGNSERLKQKLFGKLVGLQP